MPWILGILLAVNINSPSFTIPVHIETPREVAIRIATEHKLDVVLFLKVIKCESNWDTHAVGDNGTSFGLAQLHYPKRDWGITKEEAFDSEIALEIMANAWEHGQAQRWSCYP